MIFLGIFFSIIDLLKITHIILSQKNILIVLSILLIYFFLSLFLFIGIIWIIIDIIRYETYPYSSLDKTDIIVTDLNIEEIRLKKNKLYRLFCMLLYVFGGQSIKYYHKRFFYRYYLQYFVIKWYIKTFSFRKYIHDAIKIKIFVKQRVFLSYIYKFGVYSSYTKFKYELLAISLYERKLKRFYKKKIIKENEILEKKLNVNEEVKLLLEKNANYIECQEIKKINKECIEKKWPEYKQKLEKYIYSKRRYSNFYFRFRDLVFHYSFCIFWLLTTTRIWFENLRINIVEPYIKEFIQYLIPQIQDKVEFQVKSIYLNEGTRILSGHPRIYDDNKIIDKDRFITEKMLQYHFRVDMYGDRWHWERDNEVWNHFKGTGMYDAREKGLQNRHSDIGKTNWGAELDLSYFIPEEKTPPLQPYLDTYYWWWYPVRFCEYLVDVIYFYIDCFNFYFFSIPPTLHLECHNFINEPIIVLNYSLLYSMLFFSLWIVITILLLSRRLQFLVFEHMFHFSVLFAFSIYSLFEYYLDYFDHYFILDTLIYMILLPNWYFYSCLNFNLDSIMEIYIVLLNMLL